MFKHFLFITIATLLVAQVVRADEAEDAEAALTDLRQAVIDALNDAFMEHVKMATEIDMAALDTKDASEDAVDCVDKAADDAMDMMEMMSIGMADMALKATWKDEREIIHCGRADAECLTALTEDMKKETERAADMAKEQLEADREKVDKAIEKIKACAA